MRIKEIYRGNTPPRDTDSVWIRGKEILLFTNEGWVNVNESTVVDTELDSTSNHPIANSAVAASLDDLEEAINETLGQAETQLSETSDNLIKNKAVYNQYITDSETINICEIIDPDYTEHLKLKSPLTFNFLTDGTFTIVGDSYYTRKTIEYSKDGGDWVSVTTGVTPITINVVQGTKVQLRGNNSSYCTNNGGTYYHMGFGGTATFNLFGNIMSLINKTNFQNLTTLTGDYAFARLFDSSKVVSAENLALPATTLSRQSYYEMFKDCKNLTDVVSVLPAKTATLKCYQQMYLHCTGLTKIKCDIDLENTTTDCCNAMFSGCSNVTTAALKLKSSIVQNSAYASMFDGCSALTVSPEILADTVNDYGCSSMFYNCTSLHTIRCKATTFSANSFSNWVYGVPPAPSGMAGYDFYKHHDANWDSGVNGIPQGWQEKNYWF